jgi:outer membrane cobalamin receptor
MRIQLPIGALAFAVAVLMGASVCFAATEQEKKNPDQKKGSVATQQADKAVQSPEQASKPAVEPKMVITGTHIPQEIRRTGRISHTSLNVVVIDRKRIERTGARNIAEVLQYDPSVQAVGR